MKRHNYLNVGVLGGMGPEASAAFYLRIIKLFQSELQARFNYEYPEMLIHNIPSPDNVEGGVDMELCEYLVDSVNLLEKAGMQLLAIPCNTAHIHIDAVIKAANVPVMNILEETAKAIQRAGLKNVLLLGTKNTLKHSIYQSHLANYNIEALVPNLQCQKLITQSIVAVCNGTVNETTRKIVLDVISNYPQAEGVVLGCTEIPLIVRQEDIDIPCFDTAEILARATFEQCRTARP